MQAVKNWRKIVPSMPGFQSKAHPYPFSANQTTDTNDLAMAKPFLETSGKSTVDRLSPDIPEYPGS